jgi:hypothetical protein
MIVFWIFAVLMALYGAFVGWGYKTSALWVHEEQLGQVVMTVCLLIACFCGYQIVR